MLVNNQCTAYETAKAVLGRSHDLQPPPLGACMIPIVSDYLKLIQPGMRVLEIGCGSWDWVKRHCEEVGAHYEGIDTQREYLGKPTIATRIENLASLSFGDEEFDIVIGNQTMEHWGEFGCKTEWGLYQCFRACKPNGKVLLNVPIYFHGTSIFLLGQFDRLRRLFEPFSGHVEFESWGNPSQPLPNVYPRPGYWRLRSKPAYILDIHAIKDKPLPTGYTNVGALSGRMAQLTNYPASYNLYRIARRLGFFPYGTQQVYEDAKA